MKLILVRHGESLWNKENKFTGWIDIDLSEKGIEEAKKAGEILKKNNYSFDIAFTSVLQRAIKTLSYILENLNEKNIPINYSWKLNERHYGALEGMNKDYAGKIYGKNQVHLWRRSVDTKPPLLEETDPRYPGNDVKYKNLLKEDIPKSENLLDTEKRVIEYWNSDIKGELVNNKKVIIVAHGNSIRALVKYLDNLSNEETESLEIEMGSPICYELDEDLKPLKHYYLR